MQKKNILRVKSIVSQLKEKEKVVGCGTAGFICPCKKNCIATCVYDKRTRFYKIIITIIMKKKHTREGEKMAKVLKSFQGSKKRHQRKNYPRESDDCYNTLSPSCSLLAKKKTEPYSTTPSLFFVVSPENEIHRKTTTTTILF